MDRLIFAVLVVLGTYSTICEAQFLSAFTGLSKNKDDIKFILFRNPHDMKAASEIVYNNPNSLQASGFNPGFDSVTLVTHGFMSSVPKYSYPMNVIKAYLKTRNDSNYIGVDWSKLGAPAMDNAALYPMVVNSVNSVGDRVAEFIVWLIQNKYLSSPAKVHMIGHSLGSHVSGRAGQVIQAANLPKLGRITGLDPAGPMYQTNPVTNRLDPGDAEFVETIHTSMSGLGFSGPVGHVSFFPNEGGPYQPGCGFDPITQCAHNKVGDYFAMSILNRQITGCRCQMVKNSNGIPTCKPADPNNCPQEMIFGEYTPNNARGEFFLKLETPAPWNWKAFDPNLF